MIDSLVVRDFYHRFTVDEHSFLAIESLHRLKQSKSEWDKRYARIARVNSNIRNCCTLRCCCTTRAKAVPERQSR